MGFSIGRYIQYVAVIAVLGSKFSIGQWFRCWRLICGRRVCGFFRIGVYTASNWAAGKVG